jgi:hypothetical protein
MVPFIDSSVVVIVSDDLTLLIDLIDLSVISTRDINDSNPALVIKKPMRKRTGIVIEVGFPVVMEKFWALRNYALLYKHLETV